MFSREALEKKINKLETLHESVEEIKNLILGNAGGIDPALFDSEPRQPLDLHPFEFISEGTKMTMAPVLFREEDEAWWRYSGDLVRSVEILECTLPTKIHIHPIYTPSNVSMARCMMSVTMSSSLRGIEQLRGTALERSLLIQAFLTPPTDLMLMQSAAPTLSTESSSGRV